MVIVSAETGCSQNNQYTTRRNHPSIANRELYIMDGHMQMKTCVQDSKDAC